MIDTKKLIDLIFNLKKRNNEAYVFFENSLIELVGSNFEEKKRLLKD